MTGDDIVYTVEEAAQKIKLSRATTYALIAKGALPFIRVGNRMRIPRASLEAWIAGAVEQQAKNRP